MPDSWVEGLAGRQGDTFSQISTYAAGVADSLTAGATGYARRGLDYDQVVDRDSTAY